LPVEQMWIVYRSV